MPTRAVRIPAGARGAFDVLAVVALVVAAYVARRGTLPFDGLWFDDSWVAAGAIHGRFSALLTDGSGTPAFTGLLMIVHRVGSGSLHDLGAPSLVAGVAGPALLYVALRKVGYERSVAALVSAALVVARIHILYSGRVKGYTFDTLWVLLLAIALPPLVARTWRWPLALIWAFCAISIGTFSAYTMIAVAGAGVVLVLHPASDRIVRVGAVGLQAVVQLVYLGISAKTADLAGIEKVLQDQFDAHMNLTWNPIDLVRQLVTHLRRIAEVFPGGSGAWLTVFALLAVAGLIVASVRGERRSETIAARYLLLLLAMAAVGSFLHRFPFGPTNSVKVSAGGRHSLWLVPAMAFGLAAVAQRVRRATVRLGALRFAFDGVAIAAAVILVIVSYQPAPAAPYPGSESATRYLDAALRPGDVVIITSTSTFSFADSTTMPVRLVATPKHEVGFAPVFRDPRIHVVGGWGVERGDPSDIRSWTHDARRVFVQAGGPLFGPGLRAVASVLEPEGFTVQQHAFAWNVVQVWQR